MQAFAILKIFKTPEFSSIYILHLLYIISKLNIQNSHFLILQATPYMLLTSFKTMGKVMTPVLSTSPSHSRNTFIFHWREIGIIRHPQDNIFCMDHISGKDLDYKQFAKMWRDHISLVLHVQEKWRTVDHLLLHCEVARALWVEVFNKLELVWIMPTSMVAPLASWTNLRNIPQITAKWKMVPICILCCLWQDWND